MTYSAFRLYIFCEYVSVYFHQKVYRCSSVCCPGIRLRRRPAPRDDVNSVLGMKPHVCWMDEVVSQSVITVQHQHNRKGKCYTWLQPQTRQTFMNPADLQHVDTLPHDKSQQIIFLRTCREETLLTGYSIIARETWVTFIVSCKCHVSDVTPKIFFSINKYIVS